MCLTSRLDVPPSRDPDVGPGGEVAAARRQAHGDDEVGEGDGGGELQQADVVVEGDAVVVGVADDAGHGPGLLVGVEGLLGQPARVHQQV